VRSVDQEEEEVFAVPKPDAIIDPWAVMIHVHHTSIACRAVVTAFRLEHVANQAISAALILWVT
jgi:hypothetical protein